MVTLDLNEELKQQKKRKKYEYLKRWRKENAEKYKKIQKKYLTKYQIKNSEKVAQKQ